MSTRIFPPCESISVWSVADEVCYHVCSHPVVVLLLQVVQRLVERQLRLVPSAEQRGAGLQPGDARLVRRPRRPTGAAAARTAARRARAAATAARELHARVTTASPARELHSRVTTARPARELHTRVTTAPTVQHFHKHAVHALHV